MVSGIQNHIRSLNFGYRSALLNAGVKYLNALGEIVDEHTIKVWERIYWLLLSASVILVPIVFTTSSCLLKI